jgi:hypothetical protein
MVHQVQVFGHDTVLASGHEIVNDIPSVRKPIDEP